MSTSDRSVVHDLKSKSGKNPVVFAVIIAALLLGVASGFLVVNTSGGVVSRKGSATVDGKKVEVGEIVGSDDTETYKDDAEGVLREGGIEGEGAYHLEREGGENRYVYMTSSVIDLAEFEGRRVKVWGQTYAANNAPWLMEVGRLELLE